MMEQTSGEMSECEASSNIREFAYMCTSCQAIGVGKTDLWKGDMVHSGMHPLPMPAVARWGYLWAKADRLDT